jgi:hypothetical protein
VIKGGGYTVDEEGVPLLALRPGEGAILKIAFIALPHAEDPIITPPLPVGYLAALLEQQRHIVRIYDLALHDLTAPADALGPLRAFRPHIVVVATTDQGIAEPIEAALAGCNAIIMPLGVDLRVAAPGQAVAQALWWLDKRPDAEDEQSVIFEALLALDDDLDSLPFPARHLLALELYPLFTPMGDLQTTILTGQQFGSDSVIPRNPALIIAELRSVAREYGIRHFVFSGPLLSADLNWLQDALHHLASSDLGIHWEGSIDYTHVTPELLRMCQRAGCEVLCFPLNAIEVLGSSGARGALSSVVRQAHELGITVRAQILLDPSYAAMPTLIDLAATFELDDVRFSVSAHADQLQRQIGDDVALENVAEMVQSRYRSSRSRQFFIERFGPRMGPMLWRVGRAGLLGRTWQRYADGGDEAGGTVASGSTA